MRHIKLGTLICAFLAVTTFAWASESDEIVEKARAMLREAAELAELGHKEEAAHLKRKAMAMLQESERVQHSRLDERHREKVKLMEWLEKLRQEEKLLSEKTGAGERLAHVRREVEMIEDKLRRVSDEPKHEHSTPPEDIARRLEHMHIAVEHLNHAGLNDVAEHVALRAKAAQRELHEHRQEQVADVMPEIMKQLDDLRHEVGRLRDEVNELRKNE